MIKKYGNGIAVKIDESPARLNSLIMIGADLPFDDFIIILKFEKNSYFDKEEYYLLERNFYKTKISEENVKTLAKNEQILIINQSQIKPLIKFAIEDNQNIARLNKATCELIHKLGFMKAEELASIKFIEK